MTAPLADIHRSHKPSTSARLDDVEKNLAEIRSAFAEQAHVFELAAEQSSKLDGKIARIWDRVDADRARTEEQIHGLESQQQVVEQLAHTVAAAVGELRDTVKQNGELTEATRQEMRTFVTSATRRDEALAETMLTVTTQQADTMVQFSDMVNTLVDTQAKIPTSWRAVKWLTGAIAAVAMSGGAALLWLAEHYHHLAAAFKAPHP